MKSTAPVLFLTSAILSGVYFAFPSPATKVLSIYFLVLFPVVFSESGAKFSLVSLGLALSSIGDILLEISGDGLFFIGGLGSFLIAHLFYIAYFYTPGKPHMVSAAPLLLFFVGILYILIPRLEEGLLVPVVVYCSAIVTMAFLAFSKLGKNPNSMCALFGALGALSFVLSDFTLAMNKFYRPFASAKVIVMVTYYTAQTLIAASAYLETGQDKKKR